MQRQELPDMATGGEGKGREMICTHCGDEMAISLARDCNGDLLEQVWTCSCGAVFPDIAPAFGVCGDSKKIAATISGLPDDAIRWKIKLRNTRHGMVYIAVPGGIRQFALCRAPDGSYWCGYEQGANRRAE